MNMAFFVDAVSHAALPALSIILASLGFWALGMRAMMVTMQGEDSMVFAEAKGLKNRTLFFHYGMRNAMLPQTTALALALGEILSGAVLVEVVFGYPGIGSVLYNAIKDFDYYLIQGIVFTIVVSIGLMTLLMDLRIRCWTRASGTGRADHAARMVEVCDGAIRTWYLEWCFWCSC